jgi:hypothetical protein
MSDSPAGRRRGGGLEAVSLKGSGTRVWNYVVTAASELRESRQQSSMIRNSSSG